MGHGSVFPPRSSSPLTICVCLFEIYQNFPVHLCQPSITLAQLFVHWNGLSLCFEEGVLKDQPSVLRSFCRPCPLSCKAVILLFVLHTTWYPKLQQLLGTAAKITSSLQLLMSSSLFISDRSSRVPSIADSPITCTKKLSATFQKSAGLPAPSLLAFLPDIRVVKTAHEPQGL